MIPTARGAGDELPRPAAQDQSFQYRLKGVKGRPKRRALTDRRENKGMMIPWQGAGDTGGDRTQELWCVQQRWKEQAPKGPCILTRREQRHDIF
jgi:hypothetical protein